MYALTNDKQVFKQFWADERDNTPRWVNDGSHTWTCTEQDFLAFCDNAERIYLIDECALLYIERIDDKANIHFSLLRGAKVNVPDLIEIRGELFQDYAFIFGYAEVHNRGLKQILRKCGFEHRGITMLKGSSHNKVLEWQLFIIGKPI